MPLDIEHGLLRSFVAAARAGSLSRAASSLGRTQPAVSQQLRRLEETVGHPLLRRTTRGVSLTREGEVFLPYAERLLALGDEVQERLTAGTARGRWRIGLIEDLAASSLPAVLADFAHLHPALELDIVVADSPAMRARLDAGTLDLAIGDPILLGGTPRRRRVFRTAWVAGDSFDLARDPLPVALFHAPCPWREAMLDALNRAGRRWHPLVESGSLSAIQAAVRAGLVLTALLPANVQAGMVILGREQGLPDAPDIELGLYRRSEREANPTLDSLELLLWRAMA